MGTHARARYQLTLVKTFSAFKMYSKRLLSNATRGRLAFRTWHPHSTVVQSRAVRALPPRAPGRHNLPTVKQVIRNVVTHAPVEAAKNKPTILRSIHVEKKPEDEPVVEKILLVEVEPTKVPTKVAKTVEELANKSESVEKVAPAVEEAAPNVAAEHADSVAAKKEPAEAQSHVEGDRCLAEAAFGIYVDDWKGYLERYKVEPEYWWTALSKQSISMYYDRSKI